MQTVNLKIEKLAHLVSCAKHAEVLSLGNNNLRGQLPDNFKKMKHLIALDLHKNEFTGSLPRSLGHVSLLGKFVTSLAYSL